MKATDCKPLFSRMSAPRQDPSVRYGASRLCRGRPFRIAAAQPQNAQPRGDPDKSTEK